MNTFTTSLKHIRRHPYQAMAAIFIMLLTFLAISIFAFIVFGFSVTLKYFESRPQVVAFFKDEAKQENIDQLRASVESTGKVASVKFVSKKEALQIYKELNKDDPLLLDLVTEDILPASLEVSANKIGDLGEIASMFKGSPFVSQVKYQESIISTLSAWTNGTRIVGLFVIILLALNSVFVMMTVIGFKVSQKKEEIEIMRLLSATNWYISKPFIVEGILYGTIGAVVGWLIASAGLLYASPYLESFLQGIPLFPVSPFFLLELLAGELLIAVVLGVISSSFAVSKYLK
jgi:cell division transport system permease protein